MSTQNTTEQIREMILAALDAKVVAAEKRAASVREKVAVNTGEWSPERQVIDFTQAIALQQVGDEIFEVYKRVRDAVDPLQELSEWKDEFTEMVLRYGQRTPSEPAARAYAELHHKYMIEATRELGYIVKGARRTVEKMGQ